MGQIHHNKIEIITNIVLIRPWRSSSLMPFVISLNWYKACLRSQVWIPLDNNMDCSELEIVCRYPIILVKKGKVYPPGGKTVISAQPLLTQKFLLFLEWSCQVNFNKINKSNQKDYKNPILEFHKILVSKIMRFNWINVVYVYYLMQNVSFANV